MAAEASETEVMRQSLAAFDDEAEAFDAALTATMDGGLTPEVLVGLALGLFAARVAWHEAAVWRQGQPPAVYRHTIADGQLALHFIRARQRILEHFDAITADPAALGVGGVVWLTRQLDRLAGELDERLAIAHSDRPARPALRLVHDDAG